MRKWMSVVFSCLLILSGFTLFPAAKDVVMAENGDYKVVGYYTSWGPPDQLDPNKLTHLNFAFADVCWEGEHGNPEVWVPEGESNVWACTDLAGNEADVPNGSVVLGDPEVDLVSLQNVQALKNENPNLQTLVSIGGWSWSNNISLAARSEETRENFANSAVEYVREFNMDGVDLDWEYPVEGGMPNNERDPSDKQNHTLLLQAIRDALDIAGEEDGKDYLLTIASSVSFTYVDNNELDKISDIVDFINIMAYDFNGTWAPISAHNAPLYYDEQAEAADVHPYHVEQAVQGHLNAGVPSNKLVVGVPFYGRSWGNCNPETDGEMTEINGGYQLCDGNGGGDLEPGVYSYDYLKNELMNKNGFKYYWNNYAKVPYLYNNEIGEFITFDNIESMQYKMNFIKDNGLAGAMIWELSQDDGESSLLKTVAHELGISSEAPEPEEEEPENGDEGGDDEGEADEKESDDAEEEEDNEGNEEENEDDVEEVDDNNKEDDKEKDEDNNGGKDDNEENGDDNNEKNDEDNNEGPSGDLNDDEEKSEVTVENKDEEEGKQLPSTATNFYQIIVIGLIIITAGTALLFVRLKRQ